VVVIRIALTKMNVRERIWGMAGANGARRTPARASAVLGASRKPAKGEQASFANVKTWGGPRINSGRKAAARPKVRHRTRPGHHASCPVHVTMRRAKGLPSFRVDRLYRLIREAIRATRREGFRIVEYSVQADHLHLLIEADDPTILTNGMRSFAVRVAMRVNRNVLGRKRGRVWGDRYHRRELTSPSAVRSALVYVLNTHIKHGEYDVGLVDPCSSAPWFTGWMHRRDPPPPRPSPTEPPSTWLLERGWSTVGLGPLNIGEVPRSNAA
jgi:REP element-mobilizing transposase RayT